MENPSVWRVNTLVRETFIVVDPSSATGAGLQGLAPSSFQLGLITGVLVNPATWARYGTDNIDFSTRCSFAEIGYGEYAISFTPPEPGIYRALWAASSGELFAGQWVVLPESAKVDEPFAWRVGDAVWNYISVSDTSNPVTVAANLWTKQFGRAPDGTAFTPALTQIGTGEYAINFVPTMVGTYRAYYTYGTFELLFEAEVLEAASTVASDLTRAALRQQVARWMGDLFTSTLTNVNSSTVVADTRLWQETDYFKGGTLTMLTGTAAGTTKRITAYNGGIQNFTIAPAYTVLPSVGDAYEIHRLYSVDDYNDAIAEAVREFRHHFATDVADESTLVANNTWEYTIPAGINRLHEVWLQPSSTQAPWQRLGPAQWRVLRGSGDPKVAIDASALARWGVSGKAIRFVGSQFPSALGSDGDETTVSANVIVPWACYRLLQMKSWGRQDMQGRQERLTIYQQEAMHALSDLSPQHTLYANAVLVRP